MTLSPAVERFVVHWGEMGTRWGVNRSVAQVHALLYLSPRPLDAEAITQALGIARSNVSTSLKELEGWGLVERINQLGERRDFFQARADPLDMLVLIAEGRKRREIDPTLVFLESCLEDATKDPGIEPEALARMQAMLRFLCEITEWYCQMRDLPRSTLLTLMKLGRGIARFLPGSRAKSDFAPPSA